MSFHVSSLEFSMIIVLKSVVTVCKQNVNICSFMPLFHQRIKPRLGLGPLIVDSLGKKWKKIDQWTAKQNRYEGLGLSTDRPQEASGRLRRPQTVPNWSGTKNRLSHLSGRFEPRSCRTQTDWVPGRLRPPGTKPRLTQD